MNLEAGQVIGQYTIQHRIGSGGMAVVYEAAHNKLGRTVALKVMHAGFQDDPDLLARFNREARIVAGLDHPHIVPLYDFDEIEGAPYLVMKLVRGHTLKWYLQQRALSLDEINTICDAVAHALTYAHKQNVLHRDVKPANVIIADDDGTPYLTDFGLARVLAQGESSMSKGVIVGTPHYIAPEQASGALEIGPGADVYALGVMMYEMVVGQVPFAGQSTHAIIHDHIYTPPPPPTEINPEIPEEVQKVLLTALEKDPAHRYSSPRDLLDAFHVAVQASGLTQLSDDRSAVAKQSLILRRQKQPTHPDAPPKPDNVEVEWDLGHFMDNIDNAIRGAAPLGGAVSTAWAAVQKKFNPISSRPYTPPTQAQLESEIRQRVQCRINARRGWWGHLIGFMVMGTLFIGGGMIGAEVTASTLQAEIEAGGLSLAEGTMAITWATQPWYLILLAFWFGGVMAHRMHVNNLSANREDIRQKRLTEELETHYGHNWQNTITESQYADVKDAVKNRFDEIVKFWGHLWVYLFGNIGLVAGWLMIATGLKATSDFLLLEDPQAAEALSQIAAQPFVLLITLTWLMGLSIHGIRTLLGRGQSMVSELEQERQLTLSRQTPRPSKQKHKLKNNIADQTPLPVHLNEDGELTDSTLEAWGDR